MKGTTIQPDDLLTCENCGSKEIALNPIYNFSKFVCDFCKGLLVESFVFQKPKKTMIQNSSKILEVMILKQALKSAKESRSFGKST